MTRRLASFLFVAMVCSWAVPALAQDTPASDPPAHISFVDGAALLERDGRTDADLTSMPLLSGDRIRTQGGRVEVLFADGSALHLDANTVVDFQSDEVVRLLDGRIRLSVAGPARDVAYRIDAPSAWIQIADPGEYRIAVLRDAEVELAVLRGSAELVNEQGRSYIRAGERTFARAGAAPSPPYVFNSAAWDSFDRWSESRRGQRIGASAQYLPNDVRPYAAAFDTYGSWRYEQVYGYVWYPRVHVGWRPYHRGRWASLRPFGWTWIAGDPWGWPTHHYGRWGVSAGAWFWIPGRTWGPAWVSWAYAPGYVSWCPLGWNNRPVLQIVNVNVYGGRRYDPWHAWTAVPRHHFGGASVNVTRFASTRIDQRLHNAFVPGTAAPEARFAVNRSSVPIRSTGRYAVPRSGAAAASQAPDSGRPAIEAGSAGERRFPAPSRTPRMTSESPAYATPGAPAGDRRAVSRDRGTDVTSGVTGRVADGPDASAGTGVPSREYRRAPESGIRQRSDSPRSDVPITEAPGGAVRAVPRMRQPVERAAPSGDAPIDRSYQRQERSRSYPSAPPAPSTQEYRAAPRQAPEYRSAPAQPSAPPEGQGRTRAYPGYRSAPEGGAEYRGRSMPRSEPPRQDAPAPPSYRSAPERRAPSGPPPGASAPSAPSGDGGRTRQRGGDSAPSGQARRRG